MRAIHVLFALSLGACLSKPDRVGDTVDAPVPPADAAVCVPARCAASGGTCDAGTCVIAGTSDDAVACPSGMPCRIECTVPNACKKGVDCNGATTCEVLCTADSSCKDKGVDCGTADTCSVRCIGMNACQHEPAAGVTSVSCNASDCDVTCDGTGACEDGIDVGTGGMCAAHCCNGGCPAPVVDPACSRDMTCP